MNFLAPQFLWAFLAVPLVIALHFIRTRRRKETVSALFLWQQAREVAQQKRRFSASWLLLLQLLFVCLAALALARPSLMVEAPVDRVFIIDASASMAARDGDGVRLDKARAEAEALLRESGRVALIRAGLDATVVETFSDDNRRIRHALQDFVAVDPRSDLQRGLELAEAIAPEAVLHVFSDASLPSGSQAVFHYLGGDAQNVGISAFELRGQEAFISVVGNNPRPEEVNLRLERDNSLVAETTVRVSATSPADVLLATGGEPGFYRARLEAPAWDALELDNVAYAGSRALRVLQAPPSQTVERALRALPGVADVRVVESLPENTAGYDVVVIVGATPQSLPPGRYLIFAPQRPSPSYRSIIDWDRSDPLLRFVDLTGVVVAEGGESRPLPEAPWRTMAQLDSLAPAIERVASPELEVVFLNFHPSQTDLVNRTAFPILLYNIFEAFRGEDRLALGSLLPPDERVLVNGVETSRERALTPGVYTMAGRSYSVSLLSAEETRLPPAAVVETAPLPEAPEASPQPLETALWLVALALLLLLGEWLLWSRGARPWASRG
jgi:hypothetical protein